MNENKEYIPIFTEDNFHRTITNLTVNKHCTLDYPCGKAERNHEKSITISLEDAYNLDRSIDDFVAMAALMQNNFSNQFHHNCRVRRICGNPDCHTIYAYFYEDFLYCPKCGTKLTTTRDDRNDKKEKSSFENGLD